MKRNPGKDRAKARRRAPEELRFARPAASDHCAQCRRHSTCQPRAERRSRVAPPWDQRFPHVRRPERARPFGLVPTSSTIFFKAWSLTNDCGMACSLPMCRPFRAVGSWRTVPSPSAALGHPGRRLAAAPRRSALGYYVYRLRRMAFATDAEIARPQCCVVSITSAAAVSVFRL